MKKITTNVSIRDNNGNPISMNLNCIKYDTKDCPLLYEVYTKWKALCESLEKMGKINSAGQSVICLPNRVIVEIIGDDATPKYDTVVGG